MTEKKKSVKETDKEVVKSKEEENKYPLSILRNNCMKLFGVTLSTFAGATKNMPEREYTVSEIKQIIAYWLKKEVK